MQLNRSPEIEQVPSVQTFSKYSCSTCHASANESYDGSRFEYVFPDGRVTDAPVDVGWCNECRGLRPIETLEREYWCRNITLVGQKLASISLKHRLLRGCQIFCV